MLTQLRSDVLVTSRGSGTQQRFSPGRVIELRRDPSADFVIGHEKVSRRAHAELRWRDDVGWVLTDVSARSGVFVNGAAQSTVHVTGPVLVRLGDATSGEDLEIAPLPPAYPLQPAATSRPIAATTLAAAPQTVAGGSFLAGGAWRLGITVAGKLAEFRHAIDRPAITIGRDVSCDVTVEEPTVSRHHADLVPVADGWEYHDRSSGGSWLAGKRITTRRLTASSEIRLGDPISGTRIRLDVAVPPETVARWQRAARNRKLTMRGALAAAAAALLGAVVVFANHRAPAPTPPQSGMSAATLLAVERATVKLDIVDPNGDSTSWGSGTIIDRDGLILTNSHVAAPNALGMDTQYGAPLGDANPAYLRVEIRGPGPDGDVHPAYRAHTVIADGYLDLALVQIYARANGQPVSPHALHLPALTVGNSDAVHVGDDVTVVGFPGVSQSRAATVTKGDASAFVHDQRLHSDRGWIETSARIAHGNSGGAAVNDAGQLIGVPTRIAPQREGDVGWWFRPVNWAKPLIARVRAHRTAGYVTPYVTPAQGVTITPLGWSATQATACASPAAGPMGAHAPTGTGQLYLAVTVTGLASGLQLNAQVTGPAGYLDVVPGTSNGTGTSCFTIPVAFSNGDGQYNVALSVDPPGTATRFADISVGVQ